MTWYADLTPYTYSRDEGAATILNVGWLEAGQPFSSGRIGSPLVQRVFLMRLRDAATRPTGPMYMGLHQCDLCDSDGPMDTGEVRALRADGVTLAAPTLVAHYVEAHGYLPPAEFVDAICAGRNEVPPPHEEGEELSRYCADEDLADEYATIAAQAIGDLAGVSREVVERQIGFFVSYRLVCEHPGGWDPDSGGLPRMRVGLVRSGMRSIWTGDGYWDGSTDVLVRIVQGSMSEHSLKELRDAVDANGESPEPAAPMRTTHEGDS